MTSTAWRSRSLWLPTGAGQGGPGGASRRRARHTAGLAYPDSKTVALEALGYDVIITLRDDAA
jgi:hypothetical protein